MDDDALDVRYLVEMSVLARDWRKPATEGDG